MKERNVQQRQQEIKKRKKGRKEKEKDGEKVRKSNPEMQLPAKPQI